MHKKVVVQVMTVMHLDLILAEVEEDSKILKQVVEQYYSYLLLFHGKIKNCIEKHTQKQSMHLWRDQLTDFTRNF